MSLGQLHPAAEVDVHPHVRVVVAPVTVVAMTVAEVLAVAVTPGGVLMTVAAVPPVVAGLRVRRVQGHRAGAHRQGQRQRATVALPSQPTQVIDPA
jgi:hypothetical protein